MKKYKLENANGFDSKDIIILLHEPFAKNFMVIETENYKYGVAWNGGIEPQIEEFPEYDLLVVGVSESIAAASLKTGVIKLALGLGFPINFFEKMEYGFFIVAEIVIIGINGHDCSINRFIVADDIIQDVTVDGNKYNVKCLDSEFVV